MLKVLLLACILCTTSRAQTVDSRTIFKYLDDEGFHQLVSLLRSAGLEDKFSDPNMYPVTVFAPTDQAFAKVPQGTQIKLLTNATYVVEVLNGHVADEQLLNILIRDEMQKQDLNGNTLTFNIYANGVKTVNGAVIEGTDVILANGLVHPINEVMMPVTDTIANYVADRNDFRDLFGYLVLARLFGTFGVNGPFTVFAPNDAAFERVRSNMTALATNPDRSGLEELLKNHVVAGDYWKAGITSGMSLTTLQGTTLDFSVMGALITINGRAHVIQPDLGATNGVVHVIDTVLFPN